MAQDFNKLVSGLPGAGTPFAQYPDYINSMFEACRTDFAGASAPSSPVIGMTYYNTTEKRSYRYMGTSEGWVSTVGSDSAVAGINKEVVEARGTKSSLAERIIAISMQNAGNTPPTGADVYIGMPFYNKAEKAIYVCTAKGTGSGGSDVWEDMSNVLPGFNNLLLEVKTARGTTASLSARLDVALNHDGTLKGNAPAGEWWEPVEPYTFTKLNTNKLEITGGDLTALFEKDRAVLLHPSHNKAYVVSSYYESETNKTTIEIDEEVGEDSQIQFGAPVGNASKVEIADFDEWNDSLKRGWNTNDLNLSGAIIKDGENLDNVVNNGFYHVNLATSSELNRPTKNPFTLIVTGYSNRKTQVAFCLFNDMKVYVRSKYEDLWNGWVEISNTLIQSIVDDSQGRGQLGKPKSAGVIDYNNYGRSGFFSVDRSSTNGGSINSSELLVLSRESLSPNDRVSQIQHDTSTNRIFYRSRFENVWSDWKELLGTYRLLQTRATSGAVTLSNVIIGKPLIITAGQSEQFSYADLRISSGSDDSIADLIYRIGTFPTDNNSGRGSNCFIFIPSSTIVTVNVVEIVGKLTLRFNQ